MRMHTNATAPRPAWLFDPASFAVERRLRKALSAWEQYSCGEDDPLFLLPRRQRHIVSHPDALRASTESSLPDEPLTERVPHRKYRTDYELADGLQAVADISQPGQQVANFVGELYEASSDTRMTEKQRGVLQTVGAIFDVTTGFLPVLLPLKRVGMLAGLAAKTLRNETILAEDMTNLMMLFRDFVEHRLYRPSPVPSSEKAELEGGAKGAEDTQKEISEYTGDKQDQVEQEANPVLPVAFGNTEKHGVRVGVPGMPEERAPWSVFIPSGFDDEFNVQRRPPSHADDSQMQTRTGPQPQPQAEVHIAEPDPVRKIAMAQVPVVEGIQGAPALPKVREDGMEDAPPRPSTSREGTHDGVFGSRPSTASEDMQAARIAMIDFGEVLEGDASRAGRPMRYTIVDDIPVFPSLQPSGTRPWREFPREYYCECVRTIIPQDGAQEFNADGQNFVVLDGQPYPVVRRLDGQLVVFSRNNPSLPYLPLENDRGVWRFKPLPEPISLRIQHSPDVDGFIRVNNKKYIRIDDKYYEAQRVPIDGEYLIAAAVRPVNERLYGGNHISIMRSIEYGKVIEGKWGYYPVIPFGVVGAKIAFGTHAHAVLLYDFVIERWRVVTAQSGNAMAADPELMHPSLRSNSVHRIGSMESLYNWADLSPLPFYQRWPRLGAALESVFVKMAQKHLVRPNRVKDPGEYQLSPRSSQQPGSPELPESPMSPMSPSSDSGALEMHRIRAEIFRQLPTAEAWKEMGIVEKQQIAARITSDFYGNVLFWQLEEGSPAYCSEMTDIMMNKLIRALQKKALRFNLRGKTADEPHYFLQLSIRETPGAGHSHVALMVFDSMETMKAGFGDVFSSESSMDMPLRTLDKHEFREFVAAYREHILLIDAWGPEKIVDFAAHDNADVGLTDMAENLFAAGFGKNEHSYATGQRNVDFPYRVRALEPLLSGLVGRHKTGATSPDV